MSAHEFVLGELAARREAGLTRRLRPIDGPQDAWVTIDGRRVLLLCSNNYLGLANHPALQEAAVRAAMDYGFGAGASRLISGSTRLHQRLEERLAAFKHAEAALLFSSGYHANIGTIAALVGPEDAVFSDALNHASIVDGCRLSRAEVNVYPHCDMEALASQLARSRARRRLVVTDSIFSMDGDTAPLGTICELAERYGAMVMVDEAHATGCVGPNGAGVVAAEGLEERVTVQMGTLGKALGTFGAFVAARRPVVDLLVNVARSFIYTTALPPPVVGAALAALDLAGGDEPRREQLAANAELLATGLRARGFDVGSSPCHIVPVLVGDSALTMRMSEHLLSAGVFVQGIRPPTVPQGTARLRTTVMSTHNADDLRVALAAFDRARTLAD
ncbi:8-amino-7-oxononanoate synthase [Candidatus Binatia bacterium]|nr:8-amino-7-oxononanoate synthase [Candidatus Binatia bacterium]